MRIKVEVFAIFSLVVLMMVPAYANVTSIELGKSFYIIDEKISFVGTESEGSVLVNVIIRDSFGKSKLLGGFSDPDGGFVIIPQSIESIFSLVGIYNATAFTGDQREEEGLTIKLEFDGDKVSEVPDFVLQLKTIPDKSIEIEKTISFSASLTDSSIEGAVFSLGENSPPGATIDPISGKFVWTVSKSQGNIIDVPYIFDIIVNKGSQEDRENITITIRQAYVQPEKQPEPKQTTSEPKELGIAPFVDESKDPQSYVDRYDNEASYKKWFDDNFPEYFSIYEAVGLEEPKELAPFVDPNQDPQ